MPALTNAQRQKRFRERHKTGDLLPAAGCEEKTPSAMRNPVTHDAIAERPIQVSEHGTRRTEVAAVRPCPFCGGWPHVAIGYCVSPYFTVSCSGCGAVAPSDRPEFAPRIPARTLERALALWNRRPGA
jgi:hypothetical protein